MSGGTLLLGLAMSCGGCWSSLSVAMCLEPRLPLKMLVGASGRPGLTLGGRGLLSPLGLGRIPLLILCVSWGGQLPQRKQYRWGSLNSEAQARPLTNQGLLLPSRPRNLPAPLPQSPALG